MSAMINFLLEANLSPDDKKLQRVLMMMADTFDKEPLNRDLKRVTNDQLRKVYKENNLKKVNHLDLVDKLHIDKNKALIIGSSVLVVCDVVKENDDIDLVVTQPVFNKAAKNINTIKTYKREYNKVFYQTPHQELELAVNFQILNTTTEKLIDRAVNIKGYNFMSLRDTYRMYRILDRPKDVEKLRKLKKIFSQGHL
jgi:hypothetical protein